MVEPQEKGSPVDDRVRVTARRGSERRAQSLSRDDAVTEAATLRGDGWTVTIGTVEERRLEERARKARARIIADHQTARRARRDGDDVPAAR